MLTSGILGGPLIEVAGATPWALIVVPCGMDAMRTSELAKTGVVAVAGIFIHRPGSKWFLVGVRSPLPGDIANGLYIGNPIDRDIVLSFEPGSGRLPTELEKDRVCFVRLSSRTFSLGGVGGAGLTGVGKFVVVGGPIMTEDHIKPRSREVSGEI